MPILDMILRSPFLSARCTSSRRRAPDRAWRRARATELEREVRVHRAGAVADEQREVGHLARLARLDDDAAVGMRAPRG